MELFLTFFIHNFVVEHPCEVKNGGCQQMCATLWNKTEPVAQCLCQAGFRVTRAGRCIGNTFDYNFMIDLT